MNKLQKKAQKSKLNVVHQSTTKEKLLTSQRKLVYPVSFRLDAESWANLTKLLEKINQVTKRKINLTQLLKVLIYHGQFLKKEAWEQLIINSISI